MCIIFSIALPFKDRTLWSLYDEASIDLLDKYYETSVNCISTMENHEKVLEEFNNDFYKWLIRTVRGEIYTVKFSFYLHLESKLI